MQSPKVRMVLAGLIGFIAIALLLNYTRGVEDKTGNGSANKEGSSNSLEE